MSTEQLPGLQMAIALLAQIGDDDSDAAIAAVHDLADEHAQRLTLQHHACDQAQRIADLEAWRDAEVKRVTAYLVSESEAKNAELEAERNELIDQRDRGDAQNDMLLAELRQVNTERDELRARLAEIDAQEPACWAVIDPTGGGSVEYTAAWREACHEHIGNMIAEADMLEAANFLVRPLYARPVPAQAVPEHKA